MPITISIVRKKCKRPKAAAFNDLEAFDKAQHPFMIKKMFNKLGKEGKYLNTIMARYSKATANIIFN
jgi:hypothetical protein